jgi:hypothetical protein
MNHLLHLVTRRVAAHDQRGDVPGWVLVTVMTAGLCAALYGLASDQLSQMLSDALHKVR